MTFIEACEEVCRRQGMDEQEIQDRILFAELNIPPTAFHAQIKPGEEVELMERLAAIYDQIQAMSASDRDQLFLAAKGRIMRRAERN